MATQAAPTPGKSFLQNKDVQEGISGLTFVFPAVVVIGIFLVVPVVFSFVMSLTNWNLLKPPSEASFIGFANFQELLLEDSNARTELFRALRNTIYYVIGVVPLQTLLALLLAMIVNQKWLRGKGFFRTAFYLPSITSTVVTATVFLWIFNKDGLFNLLLKTLSGGGYQPISWLNDSSYLFHNMLAGLGIRKASAPEFLRTTNLMGLSLWDWLSGPNVTMIAIMLLNIWTTAGTMMLIYLAALQDIPGQLYEAANVDGATRWQQFRYVTVPMLRPTTFFVVTIGLIGTFQVFDQIFIIAPNNPGTSTMAYIVYRNAFRDFDAGKGTAIAFILFMIILGFTLIQRRITNTKNN
jgi:multiple sugar transport system permease protein